MSQLLDNLIEAKLKRMVESGFRFGHYRDVYDYESFKIIEGSTIKVIFWDYDSKRDENCRFYQIIDINIVPELRLLKLKKI